MLKAKEHLRKEKNDKTGFRFTGDFACPDGVDILDLHFFIERWLTACSQNNNFCNCTDMNYDELVNFFDFAIFTSHWLEER